MAERLAILGQSRPAAATNTDLYTVPTATQTVVSALIVANTAATATTFRVHARVGGATAAVGNALFYDVAIAASATVVLQLGLALAAATIVTVQAGAATITFTATGQEVA